MKPAESPAGPVVTIGQRPKIKDACAICKRTDWTVSIETADGDRLCSACFMGKIMGKMR